MVLVIPWLRALPADDRRPRAAPTKHIRDLVLGCEISASSECSFAILPSMNSLALDDDSMSAWRCEDDSLVRQESGDIIGALSVALASDYVTGPLV